MERLEVKMNKYEIITDARKALELQEYATMDQIKANYRRLIMRWHPDQCKNKPEICRKKAEELTNAYEIIMNYCRNYKFSFEPGEVEKYISKEEWWFKRFGDDPVWGK